MSTSETTRKETILFDHHVIWHLLLGGECRDMVRGKQYESNSQHDCNRKSRGTIQKGRGCSSEILKRTPKRYKMLFCGRGVPARFSHKLPVNPKKVADKSV